MAQSSAIRSRTKPLRSRLDRVTDSSSESTSSYSDSASSSTSESESESESNSEAGSDSELKPNSNSDSYSDSDSDSDSESGPDSEGSSSNPESELESDSDSATDSKIWTYKSTSESESASDSGFEQLKKYDHKSNSHLGHFFQKNKLNSQDPTSSRSRPRRYNSGLAYPGPGSDVFSSITNGIIWSVLGWRQVQNKRREYLVKYSSPTPDPGAAGLYVCALVKREHVPPDLLERFEQTLKRLKKKKTPESLEQAKRMNLNHMGQPMSLALRDKLTSVLSVAWNSNGRWFEPDKLWNHFTSRASMVESFEYGTRYQDLLRGIYMQIKWNTNETTWENGVTLDRLFGAAFLVSQLHAIVTKTRSKWKRIQSAAGQHPVEPYQDQDQGQKLYRMTRGPKSNNENWMESTSRAFAKIKL